VNKTSNAWDRPGTGAQFDYMLPSERAAMTPLLAHRIAQFGISLPKTRPVFDRIFVYPLEGKEETETFEGTSIVKPTKSKDLYSASKGILVKAGLGALDILWSHGIEIGHIVLVARLSPWERKYEGKKSIHKVQVLRASEVVGSDDLEDDVIDGAIKFEFNEDMRLAIADRERIDPEETDEGI